MRFANHDGRLTLVEAAAEDDLHGATGVDVHEASGGRLPAEPEAALLRWDEVLAWADDHRRARSAPGTGVVTLERERLGAPSPAPRQVFGVGLNFADHGAESGMELPSMPLIFTKLSTAVTGPYGDVPITTQTVDWEVEIAVVMGRTARSVAAADAWSSVAGLSVGQDLSDRDIQWRPPSSPQFGLGKSLPGFAPLGPLLVTPDELPDPDDLELSCVLNGEVVQQARSAQMIFPIGELIAYLSGIVPLLPGDVIFTGTPSGVGMGRTPPLYLKDGDRLESHVEGLGTMSHHFTAVAASQVVSA
jgi:2-keto-4-pentenoate hydratase/2-oxohepta-3-ene-1,7-dioic acid hydratase in catechol pathway